LDLDLRTPDGRWYLRGQATGSRHGGGAPELTLADGTALRRGDLGGGGFVSLGKQGGEPWRFDLVWEYESPRLDLNAAGYQKTQNEQKGRAVLRWVRPGGGGPFHEYLAFLGAETRWTTDGRGLNRGNALWVVAQVQLRSFHTIGTTLSLESDSDDVRELAGTGVALRRPGLAGAEVWVATDKGLPVWIELDLYATRNRSLGPLPATVSGGAQLTLAVRPHPRAETKLDLLLDDPRFAARWVEDLTSGDHLLAALHAPSLSVTLRQQLVLTPRLTLQGYAQLFAAAARYGPTYTAPASAGGVVGPSELAPGGAPTASPDYREAKLALNAVLRWEYRLGSTLFLVYTRAQAEPPWPGSDAPPLTLRPLRLARGPTTDTVLVKWTWRFGA
ncbi:MAG TPA: DUF5916 domain-containing protein, partial [Anaeromyxobacteraceae bacterium]|nr:DUF5916 domain-containing protein [Anaeromyxobacteraceae bacterium]